MTELKPCPFCGGEAEIRKWRRWLDFPTDMVDGYEAFCVNPDCIIYHADDKWYMTEAEAIEAWSTRHVRTCDGCKYHREPSEYWCEECSRFYCDFYTPKEADDADQKHKQTR